MWSYFCELSKPVFILWQSILLNVLHCWQCYIQESSGLQENHILSWLNTKFSSLQQRSTVGKRGRELTEDGCELTVRSMLWYQHCSLMQTSNKSHHKHSSFMSNLSHQILPLWGRPHRFSVNLSKGILSKIHSHFSSSLINTAVQREMFAQPENQAKKLYIVASVLFEL